MADPEQDQNPNLRPPIEQEIDVAATPEEVWRALSEGDELARWFPVAARVEPGEGGKVWLSWGPGMEGESRIAIWEPARRLRLVANYPEGVAAPTDAAGRPVEVAMDFEIEGSGGRTRVRLVHSGFGRGAEWDNEYDAIWRGWKYELRSLRHYLERHPGEDRKVVWAHRKSDLPQDEIWRRLMSPEGLGALPPGLAEGDRYLLAGADGTEVQGEVRVNRPPTDFSGTVQSLDDALLRYVHEMGGANLWLWAWGEAAERLEGIEERWKEMLERLLGEGVPGSGTLGS